VGIDGSHACIIRSGRIGRKRMAVAVPTATPIPDPERVARCAWEPENGATGVPLVREICQPWDRISLSLHGDGDGDGDAYL